MVEHRQRGDGVALAEVDDAHALLCVGLHFRHVCFHDFTNLRLIVISVFAKIVNGAG